MPWTIRKEKIDNSPEKYHKIADKDIAVYKVGYLKNKEFCPYILCDEYFYQPNALNTENTLVTHDVAKYYFIYRGFHSYSGDCYLDKEEHWSENEGRYLIYILYTLEQRFVKFYPYDFDSMIGKFIIPQGSEYYINDFNEIVSSQIMWTGEYIPIKDAIKNKQFILKDLSFKHF